MKDHYKVVKLLVEVRLPIFYAPQDAAAIVARELGPAIFETDIKQIEVSVLPNGELVSQ